MDKTERESRDRMIARLWMQGRGYEYLGRMFGASSRTIKRALEKYLTPEERTRRLGKFKSGARRKHDPEKIYNYILQYKAENDGLSPTVRAICSACGISSTSVVDYILNRLEASGRIRIDPDRFRGIHVVGARWIPPQAGD